MSSCRYDTGKNIETKVLTSPMQKPSSIFSPNILIRSPSLNCSSNSGFVLADEVIGL